MTKAKKAKKARRGPPGPPGAQGPSAEELFGLAGEKIEQTQNALVALTEAFSGIRDELRGIREELARYGSTNKDLEAATGRLGQRIGEFIEHQFHSVK